MKLTVVFLLGAALQVSARSFSQSITLSEKNVSLEKVFKQIKKQTGYVFWYEDNLLEKSRNVDIAVHDATLDEALRLCFKDQPLSYEIVGKTIVIRAAPPVALSQDPILEDVHGVVKSQSGAPLASVTVQVRDTKGVVRSALTAADGRYSVKAQPGDRIVFSIVGFAKKEVVVSSATEIDVELQEDVKVIDETVITALGIKKSDRSVGYSLTEVSGSEVQVTREPTFVNALAGKVAGLVVQSPPTGPGGSARIILRGYSSLNGTNQPLYVVDGVPIVSNTLEQNSNDEGKVYGGSDPGDGLSNINPDDIENITVLKGASAAALYGSYAQAGVIMITTKKGRKGQGLGIAFNSNTVLERMVPYNQKDFQYEYGRGVDNRLYTAADQITNGNYETALSWGAQIQGQPFLDVDGVTKPYVAYTVKDQFDHFFHTGVATTNSLSLSAGTETGSYRLSLSQTTDHEPMPGYSGMNRYNAVLRATNDFGKRLHTDVKMDVSRSLRNNMPLLRNDGRGSFSEFFVRTANTTDVRLLNNKDSAGDFLYTYINPYVAAQRVLNDQTTNRAIGSINLTYDITDHLHAQVVAGIDYANINTTFAIYPNNVANDAGQLNLTTETRERDNTLGMLTYDNKFNKFTVKVNAGAQMDYSNTNSTAITGNTFVSPTLLSLSNVTVNNSGISQYNPRSKTYSVLGEAQLGYDNYLFLELTGRNDWYSTLTFADGQAFQNSLFYPSANLSYVFTDALKWKNKVLSYGKLRAAAGQTGGNLDPYVTNLTFAIQPTVNSQPGALIYTNTLPPSTIKPEVTTEYEVGTELKFFGTRAGLDFAWYSKTTRDFLVNSNISTAAGFTSVALNAGSMRNRGVEVLLTGTPVESRNFSWDVSLNAARNVNKVLSLVPQLATTGIDNYYNIQTHVGYAMGSIFGTPLRRAPNGQFVYQGISSQGNGVIDAAVYEKGQVTYNSKGQPILDASGDAVINDNVYLGSANPDWTGGITNTFNYKNFSLSFLIDAQFGGYLYEDGMRWASFFGNAKRTLLGRTGTYIPQGVVNTGTDASPDFATNTLPFSPYQQYNGGGTLAYYADEESVFKKTFIKFRQLSLGYSLPGHWLGKSGIRSATFSLIGRNLFYFKKDVPMFDPQSSDSINNGFGYDSGGLPASRTYGFNLNLKF